MQLDYIETYIHEKLVWVSSNDQVVSVEDGVLTAHKAGEANITVTGGEYSDTISVNVRAKMEYILLLLNHLFDLLIFLIILYLL